MTRQTELMKRAFLKGPGIEIATYRTRKIGSDLWFQFKTVVLANGKSLMLNWNSEAQALDGHERVLARLQRGEPIHLITGATNEQTAAPSEASGRS